MLEKWRQRCWFKSADKLGRCGPGIEWPTLVGYTQHVLVPEQITGWLPVTPEMPHIDRPQQLNHLLYILKVTCVQAKRLRSIRHGCETSWVVLRCLALGGWQWILWGPVGFWGLWPPWIGLFLACPKDWELGNLQARLTLWAVQTGIGECRWQEVYFLVHSIVLVGCVCQLSKCSIHMNVRTRDFPAEYWHWTGWSVFYFVCYGF